MSEQPTTEGKVTRQVVVKATGTPAAMEEFLVAVGRAVDALYMEHSSLRGLSMDYGLPPEPSTHIPDAGKMVAGEDDGRQRLREHAVCMAVQIRNGNDSGMDPTDIADTIMALVDQMNALERTALEPAPATKAVTLTDMGEPADLANGLAVLRHIAEHGESFVRSGEASALLAEIGRLREIESCGDLLRLPLEPAGGWQSIASGALPEKRLHPYRVVAVCRKEHGEDTVYPGEGVRSVLQDWVVRKWPERLVCWMYMPSVPQFSETKEGIGS